MITRNIYTAFSLTLMTIILASCQNDEIESSQAVGVSGKSSVTIHCVMGSETMSRAQIVLGYDGEGELFRWNEGDSFSLFDYGADGTTIPTEQTVFTITNYSDDSQSNIADFTAECDIEEGNYVFAVYPTVSENDYWSLCKSTEGYNLGTNTDDEIKAYMKENMFMYAEGKMDGEDTDLTFNHLTSLARITYTNETGADRTISKVSISGDGDYFSYNVEKRFNPSRLLYTDEKASEEIYFENLILADGDSTEFYILFLPGDDFNTDGTITVAVDDFTLEVATSEFDTTSFEAGYRYWFVLTETENASGDTDDEEVDYVIIYSSVNADLCEVLAEMFEDVTLDDDGNALVPYSVIDSTTELNLSNSGLTSLEGLECFINLETLIDSTFDDAENFAELSSLDVSSFTKLKYLDCAGHNLTSLDVSKNTALTYLSCFSNELTALDVTNNNELDTLWCGFNDIASLDLSQNTHLSYLDCRYSNLTSLDLSNNTELTYLECGYNNLISLDLSKNTIIEYVYCNSNDLTSLNVSNCSSMKTLFCSSNDLSSLDISSCVSLTSLYCSSNNLTSLDLSNNTSLKTLSCYSCHLTTLDISMCTSLKSLDCGKQKDSSSQYITMTLYVNSDQESTWESSWGSDYYNSYVTISVKQVDSEDSDDSTDSDAGAGIGNYNDGGKY